MRFHQHIAHHVRKHTEHMVKHMQRHPKRYILGAGLLSGAAVFKLIGIIVIFFGATYIGGGSLGGDYYDAEYYQQEAMKKAGIPISTLTGCDITKMTGENITGILEECIQQQSIQE